MLHMVQGLNIRKKCFKKWCSVQVCTSN